MPSSQLAYILLVVTLFAVYGSAVRRGWVGGRAIVGAGALVTLSAVVASYFNLSPAVRQAASPLLVWAGPAAMAVCGAVCVGAAYRAQKVVDLARFDVGDTTVRVLYAPASRLQGDALLLATTTTLRMFGGVVGAVGVAGGRDVERDALRRAPVGVGKVVTTGGGRIDVGHVFHAAVHAPADRADENALRRAMENAAQQARKARAETLVVPIGALRGLPLPRAAEVTVGAVLKQCKAFREITFVALEPRSGAAVRAAVESALRDPSPVRENPRG